MSKDPYIPLPDYCELVVGAVSHCSPDHGDALAAKDADTLAPAPGSWSVLVWMPVQLALLSVKQL